MSFRDNVVLLFGMSCLFFQCSYAEVEVDNELPNDQLSHSEWATHYLEAYGMEASIKVPSELTVLVEVNSNQNFGRIEFSAGRSVDFFITEATETIESRRFDLESGIFRIKYMRESEDLIFYKATLPDGSSPYYHFFKVVKGDRDNVQFESNPLIEFTEGDIIKMLEIIETFKFNELNVH